MAKLFAIVLLALVSSKTLPAQRTERTIFQFQHAGWTAKDGAPAPTYAFTQTADGFLWMATVDGLYRFDGIRFEPYQLPSNVTSGLAEIRSLMGTPDGGLWIGLNTTGAAFLKDGRTVSYGVPEGLPAGAVFEFTVDREGTLWAGTLNGPAKFDGSRWHAVGKDSGFSAKSARVLFVDRAGTLWVASEDSLFFLIRGEKTFKAYREHAGYINSIGQTPDGALWVAQTIDDAPPGNGKTRLIRPMPHDPGTDDKRIPPIFEIFGVSSALVDHVGSLWIKSNNNQGLFRVRNPAPLETSKPSPFEQPYFENFNAKDGLTGDAMTTAQLEDRDGNLWFSSNLGVDRFRESDVVPIVNLGGFMPLARGDNGEVLSFHTDFPNQYLLHLHGLTATRQPFKAYPTAVYRDANGVLWMGGYEEFSSYANGRWTQYGFPKGVIRANVRAIAGERSGAMWVGIPGHQVYRFEHGEWTHFGNRQDLPKFNVLFLYADSQGRIWFCYPEGKSPIKVAVLDRDHVKTFSAADGLQVANSQVIAEGAGHLWIGGDRGLALFRNNRFQMVHADEGDALIGITGIVETANGDLWLNARPGIVHILATEVGRGIADPAYRR
jgi:ligand-binding sensor domain-containing protein